jgi:phage-related protein
MASSKIKGITVEIGGDTTKLGKAIGDIEKQSNSLKGELKQVEKLLKMDPGNADLMAQKQEILTRAVSETTEKLKILKDTQSQVEEQFKSGKIGEDQFRAFQREIIKTEGELNGFRSELDGTGDDLKEVGDSAEESSDGFTIMGGALADLVANAISSAISAIGDFIGSIMELSEATEEYRQMQSKLEASANNTGQSAEWATEQFKEMYKYIADDQATTNAITNLMGLGVAEEKITSLLEGATGVWASYGDSIPIEGLTEAMNETIQVGKVTGSFADTINWAETASWGLEEALKGNKEAQDAFNKALDEGLPVEDAFNEALTKTTSVAERADIVAQFLNNTYGESKKTYDEMSGSILDANEAELQLKETQAQLGEAVAPVNTALTNMKNQALQAITPLVESLANGFMNLYEWLQKNPTAMKIITAVAIALATAFTVLAGALAIQGIITGVTKAWAFLNTTLLANPITLIIALIAGLVAGFIYLWNNCDAFREFWINLWEKIKEVASKTKDVLVEFFTVTIPNAVDKVVTWFKQLPDKIRNAISSMVDKVKTTFNNVKNSAINITQNIISSVINWFKQLPGKIWSAIVGAVSKVATWGSNMKSKAVSAITSLVSNVVSKAKEIPSKIYSAIQGAISRVKSWGSSLASTAGSAIKTMASKIVSTAKSIPSKMLQIGKDIINGIKKGISGALGGLYDSIKKGLSGLVDKAKKALGINSPSKVFADTIGIAIPEGIAKGIEDNTDIADDAVTDLSDNMIDQTDKINGLTINRKLQATFANRLDSGKTLNASQLMEKLDLISERLGRLQIVLDTGELVGGLLDPIDSAMGDKYDKLVRGW